MQRSLTHAHSPPSSKPWLTQIPACPTPDPKYLIPTTFHLTPTSCHLTPTTSPPPAALSPPLPAAISPPLPATPSSHETSRPRTSTQLVACLAQAQPQADVDPYVRAVNLHEAGQAGGQVSWQAGRQAGRDPHGDGYGSWRSWVWTLVQLNPNHWAPEPQPCGPLDPNHVGP